MNDNNNKIEKLADKLNSRTNPVLAQYKTHTLEKKEFETPQVWDESDVLNEEDTSMKKKPTNPFHKLLLISFVFFTICIAVAAYLFLSGDNTFSDQNINLVVGGPIQIAGGQELSLDVGIENKNKVNLELVDVIVEYPAGTKSADDLRTDLKIERVTVGDIAPGQFAHKIFKSALFGEEGSSKDIKVTMEYHVPGSNSTFKKNKDFSLVLNSSPITIETQGVKEITSGQQNEFTITLTSNTENALKDVVLNAEYPSGYAFNSSDPKPDNSNDTWYIGDMSPKDKKVIHVKGVLNGQNDEERYFKFTVGTGDINDSQHIKTILALSSQSVTIKKPFIGMDVAFNDSKTDKNYVAHDGDVVHTSIDWVNNTPNIISNVQITTKLEGAPLDEASVSVTNGGFYDSSSNTITWSNKSTQELASLRPGDSGSLGFSFIVRATNKGLPQVSVDVSASGDRSSENDVPSEIISSISKIVKLTSDLRLASKALHFTGQFENSGPMPPKAEKETTYTVVWTVTNTKNDVSNATVKATLPSYVKWNNLISPTTENLTYDDVTGEVTWNIGSVQSQTGFSKPKKEVSFQVTFKPSVTQVTTSPVLVSSQTLTGTDNFAEAEVKDVRSPLTTRLSSDTGFNAEDERVNP